MIYFRPFLFVLYLTWPNLALALLDSLAVSGNPAPMVVNTAIAGGQPVSMQDTSTTYSVSTIAITRKITGQLSAALPAGVTLSLALQAPLLAVSQGSVALSTTPADLVTNVLILALASGLQCTYTLSATVLASPATAKTVTVILTLL